MTSQLVIFRAFYIFFFVPRPSRQSTNKKILALFTQTGNLLTELQQTSMTQTIYYRMQRFFRICTVC